MTGEGYLYLYFQLILFYWNYKLRYIKIIVFTYMYFQLICIFISN